MKGLELTEYEWSHLLALASCQEKSPDWAPDTEILIELYAHLEEKDIFSQSKLWYRLDRVMGSLRRKGLVTHPHNRAWRLSDAGREYLGIETATA